MSGERRITEAVQMEMQLWELPFTDEARKLTKLLPRKWTALIFGWYKKNFTSKKSLADDNWCLIYTCSSPSQTVTYLPSGIRESTRITEMSIDSLSWHIKQEYVMLTSIVYYVNIVSSLWHMNALTKRQAQLEL